MNINTKTKLMGAVLCALGVLSSDFACAADTITRIPYYTGGQEYKGTHRQAEGIMTMFGGLTMKAANINDETKKNEAFRLIYDAMCAYFRLQPNNFNVGSYSNDTTYIEYAKQQGIAEFNSKILAMEEFFNINTDEDRRKFELRGELNKPTFSDQLLHYEIYGETNRLGNVIVRELGIENNNGNCVDAIKTAGDLNAADTRAKKDVLMFYRCIRASMSLNNFGYSMITFQGSEFLDFVVNTLR